MAIETSVTRQVTTARWQIGYAQDCKSCISGFDSRSGLQVLWFLSSAVEQFPYKEKVGGSIPSGTTKFESGFSKTQHWFVTKIAANLWRLRVAQSVHSVYLAAD